MRFFFYGFRRMLPITVGVIPFGAVMGSVSAEAKLTALDSILMNLFVFAGAAQLAAVELMTKHVPIAIVVATGLIINLRFLLYSAALSPVMQNSSGWAKFWSAYFLTDQSYAVMSAHENELKTTADTIQFYFGTAISMGIVWNVSVLAGYMFGNFAPPSWALDYAVPLSFVVLLVPSLKNSKYVIVAVFSSIMALILKTLPYNLGLIATTVLAMALAWLITRKKVKS